MRTSETLKNACDFYVRDMAMFKFLNDGGNVNTYLKTMNTDNRTLPRSSSLLQCCSRARRSLTPAFSFPQPADRWIADKDIVDIGAAWARYVPDSQFYYDVYYGALAE
ncbi:hypothetical protein GGF31_001223 [Allomyces arbusculus]|nr:hypothetical protein GGF31_001223 [Allomyces arbusculus]